ncbi:MarR family winged helix-turn-helix transcriptional regulator [Saccharothrix longispora]|uniref:DNA-binding MarR family transcriptional regulator n=1 Tax=Saccharothrix longispora TaxID=33920 RepID=A0ABU1Q2T2_9PSEU|nr:hypothetical protein [Saccharothrix longispora]MDR6596429.1 DNA-binding MarR family transcriptional regulator [Saccharothrix longispora]
MGLTRQAVRETANALAREGAVELRDNPADRRAKLLVLTDRGRRALREVERRQAEWANELGGRIALPELRAVTGLLRDLGDLVGAPDPAGSPTPAAEP